MKNAFSEIDKKKRISIFIFISIFLISILAIRLLIVTVLQHDKWSEEATEQSSRNIITPASRGNIYDRNGKILATGEQIFTANFTSAGMDDASINKSALDLINLLQKNGDKYVDKFPIKRAKSGKLYFNFDKKKNDWLEEHGFSKNETPENVLAHYRREYEIPESQDRYDAIDTLYKVYNVSLPIVPKKMKYTFSADKNEFFKKFGIETEGQKLTATKAMKEIRKKCGIGKKYSEEEAQKILIVRNEIQENQYTKYIPVAIGKDISRKTIVEIEENGIDGVSAVPSSKRVYPNGTTASHILGYMGAITTADEQFYKEKDGYTSTDLVGKDGIEASLEKKLHGNPGIKKIRVDSTGRYVKTVSDKKAKKGQDVYLSIDLDLQKKAEASLESAIRSSKTSKSGATVAIDVNTGQILAMASYPNFDPNIFSGGITGKAWKSVQPENPRDSLSPSPLYNNATKAALPPGSTFKPVTAYAALDCGLNPNRIIQDKGQIKLGERSFGCYTFNHGGGNDGPEDLAKGIEKSCNYYFYCIATNKDWGTKGSLGYEKTMNMEKILSTAKSLGLGEKTGVEIDENVSNMPSKKEKYDSIKMGAYNAIYSGSHRFFPKKIYSNDRALEKNIETMLSWMKENPSYEEVIKRIKTETDVKGKEVENVASMLKFDYFNFANWTTADIFNLCIGQGENRYTPVQLARYTATMASGGKKRKATLIYGIENEGKNDDFKYKDANISETDSAAVRKGMEQVVTNGGLKRAFSSYDIRVAGKTGTAEYQGVRQPKDEVEFIKANISSLNSAAGSNVSWEQVKKKIKKLMLKYPKKYATDSEVVDRALIEASGFKITTDMINKLKGTYDDLAWSITFAPADNPQIAVATLLIEGHFGEAAGPVCADIISGYLNLNKSKEEKNG